MYLLFLILQIAKLYILYNNKKKGNSRNFILDSPPPRTVLEIAGNTVLF